MILHNFLPTLLSDLASLKRLHNLTPLNLPTPIQA
jgi:hypothetical protein